MDNIKHIKSDRSFIKFGTDTRKPHLNVPFNLRSSNTFCDASILLEDGGCIPVHRVILCSATEYFQ